MNGKVEVGDVFAIDFDGTCVTHAYPKVGQDIGAARVLKRITNDGGLLLLWTMRSGQELEDATNWFKINEIPLFGIQENPTQKEWTTSPKAYAQTYIDDAALGCPLKDGPLGARPFVDWNKVEEMLFDE